MRNNDITDIVTSGTGTIPEGAVAFGVINTGAGNGFFGPVDGQGLIPAGTSVTFPATQRTYPVMFYIATGTTLIIKVIK